MSLALAQTLVVKVGSSLVTNEGRGVDVAAIARWAKEVAELRKAGRSVLLVSSGAMSTRCNSNRVRETCLRNWMPSPAPSAAPSISPGISAITKL